MRICNGLWMMDKCLRGVPNFKLGGAILNGLAIIVDQDPCKSDLELLF